MRRQHILIALCLSALPAGADAANSQPVALAQARPAPIKTLRDFVVKTGGRQAYGLYLNGKKIGWMVAEVKLAQHEGQEVADYHTEGSFTLRFQAAQEKVTKSSDTFFTLQGDGPIVFMDSLDRENDKERRRSATREGAALLITTEAAGQKTQRRAPLSRETLRQYVQQYHWLLAAKPGSSIEGYTTALDDDAIETKQTIGLVRKQTIVWGGVPTPIYSVRIRARGGIFDVDEKADGTPIKAKLGGMLDMRAEEEASAKNLDAAGIDMLEASAISVNADLGNPAKVTSLTLRVSGLDGYALPDSQRQRGRRDANGTVTLQLTKDGRVPRAAHLTATERANYLADKASYGITEPQVAGLARQLVRDEKDPVKASALLAHWVYKNLHKRMASNAESALEVLHTRVGDCTEHGLLFVALARAAGIPAREVGGVAYSFVGRPLFAWHEWAEIHDGSQWVTIDPTWNEVYVDATHVKFSDDNEDYGWLQVLGKVKFQVVGFK